MYFQYDGEWRKKDGESYEWSSMNEDLKSMILDDVNNVTFSCFVERIRERLLVNTSTRLKLSYISLISKPARPKYILDDIDVKCYLLDRCAVSHCRSVLYVELIEESERNEDEANEMHEKEIEEEIRDDYFDVHIEAPISSDVPFTSIQKGNLPSEPTFEHTSDRDDMTIRSNMGIEIDHCEILETNDCCTAYNYEDGLNVFIGEEFKSKEDVKNLVIDASLKACFDFKIIKSTKTLFVVKCVVEDCEWKLRAAIVPNSGNFSIRTYNNIHSCSSNAVDKRNRQATASLVADMLRKEYPGQLDTPVPKAIMNTMKNRGVTISYHKAWRAKQMAASGIRGAPHMSFTLLPRYLHMLKKLNPGTVTHLVVDDNQVFKYFFHGVGGMH